MYINCHVYDVKILWTNTLVDLFCQTSSKKFIFISMYFAFFKIPLYLDVLISFGGLL